MQRKRPTTGHFLRLCTIYVRSIKSASNMTRRAFVVAERKPHMTV